MFILLLIALLNIFVGYLCYISGALFCTGLNSGVALMILGLILATLLKDNF